MGVDTTLTPGIWSDFLAWIMTPSELLRTMINFLGWPLTHLLLPQPPESVGWEVEGSPGTGPQSTIPGGQPYWTPWSILLLSVYCNYGHVSFAITSSLAAGTQCSAWCHSLSSQTSFSSVAKCPSKISFCCSLLWVNWGGHLEFDLL